MDELEEPSGEVNSEDALCKIVRGEIDPELNYVFELRNFQRNGEDDFTLWLATTTLANHFEDLGNFDLAAKYLALTFYHYPEDQDITSKLQEAGFLENVKSIYNMQQGMDYFIDHVVHFMKQAITL
ncbi:unnamed protein product [Blepharisma stoltei]|uniref:Uncharacterized protein n=1 Tax=Blepharisma stoltei TaxID=1481888 RepID=A0AAU9JA74_9CILI|nr:unnamed protein product [Blepharisma stoltei]